MPFAANTYDPANLPAAEAAFRQAYPCFEDTRKVDALRATDYARLDAQGHVYLDYTGGGLYAESQLRNHMDLLSNNVLGNPHSANPTSLAMTRLVDQARAYVLTFFNAPPDEYTAIFTPNASGALKLVGESFPFDLGGIYALTFDNHNSVNGIREFARAKGSAIHYLPVDAPDLRLDEEALDAVLRQANPDRRNLLAYPAQSNFSGVRHPLEWIAKAQAAGWDVLLDAAAYAPTNRLDLSRWKPDFVSLSFYKIFGYPTGIGCLLARKEALARLRRPWFAGGTISIASVQGDGHYLLEDEAGFEDGTVDYLNIPAVEIGLRHIAEIGIDAIHERVVCLTGWLLDQLTACHHSNGQPMIRVFGPDDMTLRGGTVTIGFLDPAGQPLDDRRIEQLANHANISLRTGCFCNPGAGEIAHGLTATEMLAFFGRQESVSFLELRQEVYKQTGQNVSSIRISVGLATNFVDIYRFMHFAAGFRDKTAAEVGVLQDDYEHDSSGSRDTP